MCPLSPLSTCARSRVLPFAAPLLLFFAAALAAPAARTQDNPTPAPQAATPGALQAVAADGKVRGLCPLKHTDVRAEITGFLSRVTVTQEFVNPFADKIEAVYTFPLPQAAAVDDMTMKVGERVVRGRIMPREQAAAVYAAARSAGHVAGLLDQERPNVFTQSVANISPGEAVLITISYVETLKYDEGTYEFSFPTVVGPRYIPGEAKEAKPQGGGRSPDTDRVPDASRITPPIAPEGTRAGHDISIEVALDAGVPLEEVKSTTHEIEVERASAGSARVRLKKLSAIPNRDFVLRYDVAGQRISDAVLAHRSGRGGYFTLILQPPERVTVEDVTPKELVFVLDTSGSMSGFPIEKAKEAMKHALDGLYPQDTFNLITFAGDTHILFPEPVPATKENLDKAQRFLASRAGGGGTEMMKAIRAALDPSDSRAHVRIVCFMTDGEVGNDFEIISEVQKHPNARVFAFGIGSSVNRFLLDKVAEHGRGEVEYVKLNDDGSAAARRFHRRVREPQLTDISVDWGGLAVEDVYPKRIPDLFSAKPVILSGRYTSAGRGVIRLRGRMGGNAFERELNVQLPEAEPAHDVLSTLWARRRVEDLMSEDYAGAQRGAMRDDVRLAVTNLGLEHRMMTQFTSFVAVEEMTVTEGGEPRRVEVPVELPAGVSRAAVFGTADFSHGVGISNSVTIDGLALQSLGGLVSATETVTVTSESQVSTSPPSQPGTGRTFTKDDMWMVGAGEGAKGAAGVMPKAKKPSKEEEAQVKAAEERARLLSKLHPSLAAVVERLEKKGDKASPGEARFVRDGKAEVQVWLNKKSPEVLAELRALGFELTLDPQTAKLVIGRLPVEQLAALAALEVVRYAAPKT